MNRPDERRMGADLALIDAGIAFSGRAQLQPPVVRHLRVEGEARVARVGLLAEGEQVELFSPPSHPRDLR